MIGWQIIGLIKASFAASLFQILQTGLKGRGMRTIGKGKTARVDKSTARVVLVENSSMAIKAEALLHPPMGDIFS